MRGAFAPRACRRIKPPRAGCGRRDDRRRCALPRRVIDLREGDFQPLLPARRRRPTVIEQHEQRSPPACRTMLRVPDRPRHGENDEPAIMSRSSQEPPRRARRRFLASARISRMSFQRRKRNLPRPRRREPQEVINHRQHDEPKSISGAVKASGRRKSRDPPMSTFASRRPRRARSALPAARRCDAGRTDQPRDAAIPIRSRCCARRHVVGAKRFRSADTEAARRNRHRETRVALERKGLLDRIGHHHQMPRAHVDAIRQRRESSSGATRKSLIRTACCAPPAAIGGRIRMTLSWRFAGRRCQRLGHPLDDARAAIAPRQAGQADALAAATRRSASARPSTSARSIFGGAAARSRGSPSRRRGRPRARPCARPPIRARAHRG